MSPGKKQHLIFGKGTSQELEVFKISGRFEGPTVMLLGGIHGNEPGAYLSADLYTTVSLKRGNLIVVPRANFLSIIHNRRGNDGDMNRKFAGIRPNDPEKNVIDVLKSLMAESDVLLTLHNGTGFYRPEWISPKLNHYRYGQSIIADAASYTVPASGKVIPLRQYAEQVIQEVNKYIDDPLHTFRFFNMRTASEHSLHKEQRASATFYALTELGIPAFCIEISHSLPSLELKVYQQNLVVNAFLNLFGVELEQPGLFLDRPALSYVVVSVNETLPLAVPNGQTLLAPSGATVEIADVRGNYERGIKIAVQGLGTFNALREPFTLTRKTTVTVHKDMWRMGQIEIAPLPQGEAFPRIVGNARIMPLHLPTLVSLPTEAVKTVATSKTRPVAPSSPIVDGRSVEVKPGDTLSVQPRLASVTLRFDGNTKIVAAGARVKIPAGTPVEILEVSMRGGIEASNLRLTLGGHPVDPALPQTCIMRDIALNFRVFNGNVQAGRIIWTP